jgi:hypothetical protein
MPDLQTIGFTFDFEAGTFEGTSACELAFPEAQESLARNEQALQVLAVPASVQYL